MSESQPGSGPEPGKELEVWQAPGELEPVHTTGTDVAVLDRPTPGKTMDIFRPFEDGTRSQSSKELVPSDGHSKELVVPDDHSEELVVPEDTSKELVPVVEQSDRITSVVAGVTEKAERQSILVSAEKKFDAGSTEKGGRIRRFIRNIVRHDIGREFVLLKNRKQAEKEIEETHRLYNMTEEQWQDLSAAHIQRVLDDREVGEMMDEKAGERQVLLESQEGGKEVRGVIDSLVVEYVKDYKGKYDTPEGKASMQEEMRRRLAELAKDNPSVQALLGEGEVYMSNIIDVAEAVRQRVSHEQGIEDVLSKVDILTARLDPGARTELKKTNPQKAFDWLSDHAFGTLNGTNVALAASIGYGVASYFAKTSINGASRLVTGGIFGFGSALIGGAQEKFRLRQERAQVQREAELGYNGEGSSKRREILVDSLNEMKNATDLTELLKGFADKEGKYEVTAENFNALLEAAVESSARRDLSSTEQRAFLSFSGETETQNAEERRQLFLQTVHARKALREYYESQGLSSDSKKYGKGFDEFFDSTKLGVETAMLKEASAADKEFGWESTKLAIKKGFIIAGVGFVGGGLTREAMGFFSDHIQNTFEAFTNQNSAAETSTGLAFLAHAWNLAPHPSTPNVGPPNFLDHALPKGGNFKLDDRLNFTENSDGTMTIKGPNGLEIDNLQRNADGTLTKDSWLRVHNAGLGGSEAVRDIPGGTTSKTVDVDKYSRAHGTRVDRSWWDNDTAKIFEKNEERLQLFKRKDGAFVYSIRGMIAGDSTHRGDVSSFPDGHFKMAFSLTQESQARPIMVDIKDGHAVIKPGSPLYKLFSEHNGRAEYKGRFAEAVEMMKDRDHDGIQNIRALATDSGPGSVGKIPVEVPTTQRVGDMSIFMKTPETPTPGMAPELDILFVYPPYRSGLRTGMGGGEKSEGGQEPDDGTSPNEPEKSRRDGNDSGETNSNDKNAAGGLFEALRDAKAANQEAIDEFAKSGESDVFREKAKKAAELQVAVNKVREDERRARTTAQQEKSQTENKSDSAEKPEPARTFDDVLNTLRESAEWKAASVEDRRTMEDEMANRWAAQTTAEKPATTEQKKPPRGQQTRQASRFFRRQKRQADRNNARNTNSSTPPPTVPPRPVRPEAEQSPQSDQGASKVTESGADATKRAPEQTDSATEQRDQSRRSGDGRENERHINNGEVETDPRYRAALEDFRRANREYREFHARFMSGQTEEGMARDAELRQKRSKTRNELNLIRERIIKERTGQKAA